MIDSGLSLAEYERTWGKHGDDGDFCMLCKMGVMRVEKVDGGKEVMA